MAIIRAVIDTDPGIDDAVAILYALSSPAFEVLGITTVAGNIGIATTTRNAGRLLALIGRADVPVVAGASEPLARKGFDSSEIHGNDGLGGVRFPDPLQPAGQGAVEWLAALLMREPAASIDVLALGPLTNLARLVTDHPAAAARICRLIAMGGVIYEAGNVGPRAEFNIAADPEAAAIVLGAGLPIWLIPLDATRQVRADAAYLDGLRASGTKAAVAVAALIQAYFESTTVSLPPSPRPGGGQRDADEVGPDDKREDPLPEPQPKVAEGEQPARKPQQAELVLHADGSFSHDAPPSVGSIGAGRVPRHEVDQAAMLLATSRPLHDPCVMLLAERPELFGCTPMGLAVDLAQSRDAGTLTPDPAAPPVQVALRVDGAAALALLAARLGGQ
ncbi:MAG: nucleoside hydrolase [Phaeovulum sp.]|uniref:nucleoside hydrolase n=1 Tax=Phaeovulum sp. TaxID=2934796 RepID=UPI002730D07C|nr:nucleoside hydrolase [Phaeovulum sp.]MDP2064237.1 nucleoside hydrolase [Phaeovulum sp.]